jgi:hypothetical protein
MTIQELINQIPFEILQRGQNYFDNGNILQRNKGHNGTWHAEVEGNYGNYEVEIETDNKKQLLLRLSVRWCYMQTHCSGSFSHK